MRKYLAFLAVLFFSLTVNAQPISHQKTLAEALSLAAKYNKPVFVMISAPAEAKTPASGSLSKKTAAFYNKNFISYNAVSNDTSVNQLKAKYIINSYPAFLFLDSKGIIVHKAVGKLTDEQYAEMGKSALKIIASGKTISYYEQLNKNNKLNRQQLRAYINLKQQFNLFDNAELIDKYVGFLIVNELSDYNEVLFILKAGPYVYGKTYMLAVSNTKIYDSIYRSEPFVIRQSINTRLGTNTLNEAIRTKNVRMAQNVASFTQATLSSNYREAGRAGTARLLTYYNAVKDTASYLRTANYYFDNYYMNISIDSAKKLQYSPMQEVMQRANELPLQTTKDGNTTTINTIVVRSNQSNTVANVLNTAAWNVYSTGTRNKNYLFKAMQWSQRSILFDKRAAYYDTLAHLLYRLDFVVEAVSTQNQAIAAAVSEAQPPRSLNELKAELDKMKQGNL